MTYQTNYSRPLDDTGEHTLQTIAVVNGTVVLKDQLKDYQFRGQELFHMNFLDFMLNTYESSMDDEEENNDAEEGDKPKRGRPRNVRVPYREEANKPKSCRIVRSRGHETLPRFIGKWFHRNDREIDRPMHNASMLMLLKPWIKMDDLKDHGCTFEETYERMISGTSKQIITFISNAQYYYECSDGAKEDEKNWKILLQSQPSNPTEGSGPDPRALPDEARTDLTPPTEDDIELARAIKTNSKERVFGIGMIEDAIKYGIFDDEDREGEFDKGIARLPTQEEVENIEKWEKVLQDVGITTDGDESQVPSSTAEVEPSTSAGTPIIEPAVTGGPCNEDQAAKSNETRPKLAMLNKEQRRAHDIIENKLKEHIAGKQR